MGFCCEHHQHVHLRVPDMAAPRGRPKKDLTMEDLTAKISQLTVENRELRKALGSTADPRDRPLTATEKEAQLTATVGALSAAAAKKIEARVRTIFSKVVTQKQVDDALKGLSLRIDVCMSDGGTTKPPPGANNRRRRGASTTRAGVDD